MQAKQSVTTLVGAVILLLFALTVISFVPGTPTQALAPLTQADPQPHISFEKLNDLVSAGENLNAGLIFANFPCIDQNNDGTCNSDDKFTTVTYRFDLVQGSSDGPNADHCEGQGFGTVSNFSPSQYSHWGTTGTIPLSINRNCPPTAYTLKCTVTYTEPGSNEAIPLACNCGVTIDPAQELPTATPTVTPIPATATPTATPIPATATPTDTSTPTSTPMPPPTVRIDGLPFVIDRGQQTPFNMIFEGIDDSDQYNYRADVTNTDNEDVDECEGTGLGGSGKYTGQLDVGEDGQVTVHGEIDALCPADTYTLTVTLIADGGYTYTATKRFPGRRIITGSHRNRHAHRHGHQHGDQHDPRRQPPIRTPRTRPNRPHRHGSAAAKQAAAARAAYRQPATAAQYGSTGADDQTHARTDRNRHESTAAKAATAPTATAAAKAATAAYRYANRHGHRSADTHAYGKNILCAAPESGRADADRDAYADRCRPANADGHGYAFKYPGPNPYAHGHTYGRAHGPAHK